ncbi:MAG: SH3 domain-containing protein [Defluviitaleaceae bacterium]|nr:SH3 domain-containing protein [Defluviitaleaceae bacterium]
MKKLVHHNISNHTYSCVSFPATASTRPNAGSIRRMLPTLVRVVLVFSLYLKMRHANMRHYLRFAALGLNLLVLIVLLFISDLTVCGNETTVLRQSGVMLNDVAVYSEPEGRGQKEGMMNRNRNVMITGRHGLYTRVSFEGLTGYIPSESVTRTQQFGIGIRVANVHLEPDDATAVVSTVGNGRRVNVRYITNNWAHVRIDGIDGWVRDRYLDIEQAKRPHRTLMQVYLRQSPYAASQRLGTMAYGTVLYVLQHSNTGFSQIVIHTEGEVIEGWVVRNQLEYYDRMTTISEPISLRRHADTTSHSYAKLDQGTAITVLGRVTHGGDDFYRVVSNVGGSDRHAWVLSRHVHDLPVPDERGDNPLGNPFSRMTTTTQSGRVNVQTSLQEGPDATYRELRRLNRGANIAIINYHPEEQWVRIRVDGQTGYVPRSMIYLVSQGVMLVYADLMRGPNMTYEKMKHVFAGQTMQVRARSREWFRVTVEGVTGYLKQEQVHVRPYEGNTGAPSHLDLPYYVPRQIAVKNYVKNHRYLDKTNFN